MQLKFATYAVERKGDERTAVSLKNNTFSIFWQKLAGGVQQEIVKTTFPVHLHPESPVSRRRCQTKTENRPSGGETKPKHRLLHQNLPSGGETKPKHRLLHENPHSGGETRQEV